MPSKDKYNHAKPMS